MQILRPHPGLPGSERRPGGGSNLCFWQALQLFVVHAEIGHPLLHILLCCHTSELTPESVRVSLSVPSNLPFSVSACFHSVTPKAPGEEKEKKERI